MIVVHDDEDNDEEKMIEGKGEKEKRGDARERRGGEGPPRQFKAE